jgi:hypothetical protein
VPSGDPHKTKGAILPLDLAAEQQAAVALQSPQLLPPPPLEIVVVPDLAGQQHQQRPQHLTQPLQHP